jgi:WD40 repeat protein
MKRLSNFLNISWLIILLVGLGLVLNLILPNLRGRYQPELQELQARTATTEPSTEPTLGPTSTSKPSPTVTLSPFLEAYPPVEATLPPQPTAIPPKPVVLPPLPTYPPIGAFSGMRVVYTNHAQPGYYSSNIDGSEEVRFDPWSKLRNEHIGGLSSLLVAPDGSKVLYSFSDSQAYAEGSANAMSIWTSDPDGSNIHLLVTQNPEWFPVDAIWSPDGKLIAYRRVYTVKSEIRNIQTPELWVMEPDGSNQHLVTADPLFRLESFGGKALFFRWLRDGYIYFVDLDDRLIAVNPENGTLFPLFNNVDSYNLASTFSPDGQRIVSSHALSAQVIEQRGFISVAVPGELAGWSLDGSKVIYVNHGIRMRDVITGQDISIVADIVPVSLSLSPDNQFLAYQTEDGLFVVDMANEKKWLVISDPKTSTGYRAIEFQFWIPVP